MMNTKIPIVLAFLWFGNVPMLAQSPVEVEFVLIQAKEERVLHSLITRRSNRDGGALHREFQYLLEDGEAEVLARATLVARDGQEAALHAGREIKFPVEWEASPKRDKVVPTKFHRAPLGTVASVTPTINVGAGTITLAMAFEDKEAEPRKWDTRLAKNSGNPPSEIDFIPTIHSEGLEKSVVSVVDGVWSAIHWTRARVHGSTTVTVSGLGGEQTLEKPFSYTQVLFARAKVQDGAADEGAEPIAEQRPPATVHLVVLGVSREFVSAFLEDGIPDHGALFEKAYGLALRDQAYIANYVGLTTDSGKEGRGGQVSGIGDAIQFDYLESVGRVVPTASEFRRVGVSLSSQPHVSRDASYIQMRLSLDRITATTAQTYPVVVLGKPREEQGTESYRGSIHRGIKTRPIVKNGGTILAGFGPASSIDEPSWSRWQPRPGIREIFPTLLYFVTSYAGDASAVPPSTLDDEALPRNYLTQAVQCKPANAKLGTRFLKAALEPDASLYAEMLGSWDVCHGVVAPSGNQGEVWSQRRIVWPTFYGDAGSGIIAPGGPQTAVVGTSLRCEPVAGPQTPDPSQRAIDLVFNFDQVTPTKMLGYPVDVGDSEKQVVFPQFHRNSVETRPVLRSAEPRLLSVLRADPRVVTSKVEGGLTRLVFGQIQEILAK